MTFDEKNAWAFGIIAVLTYAAYAIWVLVQARDLPLAEVDYIWPMITAIIAAIILGIVATIVISILRPSEAGVRDERDREINRRGEQTGQSMVVIGGLAVVVLAMIEAPYFWIANVMYLAFVLSAVLATLTKIAGYRVGLPA
jgi:cell division protein FtsW (lipid II flippase)